MRARRRGAWSTIVCLVLVVLGAGTPLDDTVHDLTFRHLVSHEARLTANGFTLLGTTEAGAGLLAALTVASYRTADAALWRASVGGLAGLVLGGLASQLVKHAACRARPRLVEGWGVGAPGSPSDPDRVGFFHWPCFARWRYPSFPSGHATTAVTVAAALVAVAPERRALWLAIAAGVAASRVILNAHFLSDALAGGLLGWWAGQAGLWLVDRYRPRLGRVVPPPRPLAAGAAVPGGEARTPVP